MLVAKTGGKHEHGSWLPCNIIESPTLIYGDNFAALNLTVEDFVSTGNQYIYLPYHYNKEVERLGYANFRKKSSKYNLADLFTKPTPKGVNTRLSDYLCGYKLINPGIIEDDL